MIGGILALGPLAIIGAALLHAAEATRGMLAPCILILHFSLHSEHPFLKDAIESVALVGLHLRIQNTDLERGPTPAHLWTADQEVGALMRMDIADRLEERGLFLSAVEAVRPSRATAVNLRMVAYLLCLSEPYVFCLDYHSQHQRSIARLFAVRISLEDTERGSPILSRWTMTTIAAPGPLLRVFISSFVV
jgi:hypothetical protein